MEEKQSRQRQALNEILNLNNLKFKRQIFF